MFLRSLTLKGFKSFGDPARLDLEPGVTVVVGPNGSGKSNVVDAIAWVLGAQRPGAVRSQKMDDVIFAGTADRAALGRAEVSLTIDNTAGLLPIDFTEVTISRTLFRTGESEYAINQSPCRLLDIQELLSDSGVGRTQHVIISQGQIDAVLNSRPEERRMIIEEAAGVLKYRRRKEKAERRLDVTEGNLERLADLVREVRRQLRPLERQADAARRHKDVRSEMEALRSHLLGNDLARLSQQLTDSRSAREGAERRTAELTKLLTELDTDIVRTEARLAAMGVNDLAEPLARLGAANERARGLNALLVERRRGLERARHSAVDAGVVASLEADAARTRDELATVEADALALAPAAEELAEAESDLERRSATFETEWSAASTTPPARAAELRGALETIEASLGRSTAEAQRLEERRSALGLERGERSASVTQRAGELAGMGEPGELEAQLEAARSDLQTVETSVEAERERVAEISGTVQSWVGRRDALAQALDRARAQAGVERLSGLDGVLGTLLDLVRVDDGFEAAFEAAAAEALGGIVVKDPATARSALDRLRAGDAAGSVVPLVSGERTSGSGGLLDHVTAIDPTVAPLLDRLVGHVQVAEDVDDALARAVADPRLTIVSRTGDRFAPTGWRIGADSSGATGAALDEATLAVETAETELASARARLDEVISDRDVRKQAVRDIERSISSSRDERTSAAKALATTERSLERTETELAEVTRRLDELGTAVALETTRRAELLAELPDLEAAEQEALSLREQQVTARKELDERVAAVAGLREDLGVRLAALEERRELLKTRLAEVEERLERSEAQRREAAERRSELDRRDGLINRLAEIVESQADEVEVQLAEVRRQREAASAESRAVTAELEERRRLRAAHESELNSLAERRRQVEVAEAETDLRVQTLVETLRSELGVDPDTAMAMPAPDVPEGVSLKARLREVQTELERMGPINPLALEEFEQLQERHEFLQEQMADVKASRTELRKVITAIDTEIVQVFSSAYADVSENFTLLFERLFPGGRGKLTLTEPNDLLATGIEVEAKPSGKNVKKLSLLSGGERSLTALAFLFAVFRSRPSPFYVMDEVEAALDDVNLHRFLSLVEEFRDEAQLMIVSHQKRTMEAADCLYGVSMKPGGSSRVVSEKTAVERTLVS